MQLDSVKQLQTLNFIMKAQFGEYPVTTAMVLGVAGGNGLEHVDYGKLKAPEKALSDEALQPTNKPHERLNGIRGRCT